MKEKLNRSEFLKHSASLTAGLTVGALAGGAVSAITPPETKTGGYTWPWPYTPLDLETARIIGHDSFWNNMFCCAGAFNGVIGQLKTALGSPFTELPVEMMLYGAGGGAGWGTVCGSINGAAAAISLVTPKAVSDVLVNELYGWYTENQLPTDASNTLAVEQKYTDRRVTQALAQNASDSPLCHQSVTQWCNLAGFKVGSNERKERCARLTGDVAAKAVELLNANLSGTFTTHYTTPAAVAACLACHGGSGGKANVAAKMSCLSCHVDHGASAVNDHGMDDNFSVEQNAPNPFQNQTTIRFKLPKEEKVYLEIIDLQGKKIKSLINGEIYPYGDHSIDWNGKDERGQSIGSGMYFYRIRAGRNHQTRSMLTL